MFARAVHVAAPTVFSICLARITVAAVPLDPPPALQSPVRVASVSSYAASYGSPTSSTCGLQQLESMSSHVGILRIEARISPNWMCVRSMMGLTLSTFTTEESHSASSAMNNGTTLSHTTLRKNTSLPSATRSFSTSSPMVHR
eukprot:CAMPEP_0170755252 /NCGR_PEP_ID=MMETSP0437-20130122/13420_1 /TAXON_ID=0 /ORGANISM="Sexangularia sp." /LENGTH=142 /DNA_ID=CAMNT_0011094411 /DNA_START=204 /DNA_END=632 /DNA_ORIENTATION=+